MLQYTERAGAIKFSVRVVPRASRSGVVGEHDGALRVRVAAPPVEGAANEELVYTLARALSVLARDVEIISGHSSKVKQVRVRGVEREALERLAREK
ncbi:MAG TPA: DUF167 domain-containing protein [Pyrinomonadaceae bacterium]|nr:DUF167 domain-containing protein [Pyrinomonadaceae bacterium]